MPHSKQDSGPRLGPFGTRYRAHVDLACPPHLGVSIPSGALLPEAWGRPAASAGTEWLEWTERIEPAVNVSAIPQTHTTAGVSGSGELG